MSAEQLGLFRDRAMRVIEAVWGGEHHVGNIKWEGDVGEHKHCRFSVYAPNGLSTWDYDELTRLVVAVHDECLRACVLPGLRYFSVLLSEKQRTGRDPIVDAHPTMDDHLAAIHGGLAAMRELCDRLRADDKKNA